MKLAELDFPRPAALQATEPAEFRPDVKARDGVRLLVSAQAGARSTHHHSRFANLANFLDVGDLLVVNRSATLPASLSAEGRVGPFILNLSTRYSLGTGDTNGRAEVWLAEPRWRYDRPGPLPLKAGEPIRVANLEATLLRPHPGLPRLWFVRLEGDVSATMQRYGEPIRYGYVEKPYPLSTYQTIFADTPDTTTGSAEMPSAARPFSEKVLACLTNKGVGLAKITLHTGVSSLELTENDIENHTLFAEPFEVTQEVADAVNETRARGQRVIAVGTTVVRALESAWDGARNGGEVRSARGFTRHYVHPGRGVDAVDGLISGFHDPKASHLAMLYALAGRDLIREAYEEAVKAGYLWHEFGDSHLILPEKRSERSPG